MGGLIADGGICDEIIAGESKEQGDLTKALHCCVNVIKIVVIAEGD